jgi:hypothetical protein
MAQTLRRPEVAPAASDVAGSQQSGWDSDVFFLPPGTLGARAYGCSCAPAELGRGTVEYPYFLNVCCPLHDVVTFEEHCKGPRH